MYIQYTFFHIPTLSCTPRLSTPSLSQVIDYKLMAAPAVMDSGGGGGSHLSVAMPGSPKSGGGRGSSVRDTHFKTNNMTASPQVSRHGQVQNMRKPLMVFDKSAAKEALIKRWRARLRWAPKVCLYVPMFILCVCRCTSIWQRYIARYIAQPYTLTSLTYIRVHIIHTYIRNIGNRCIPPDPGRTHPGGGPHRGPRQLARTSNNVS